MPSVYEAELVGDDNVNDVGDVAPRLAPDVATTPNAAIVGTQSTSEVERSRSRETSGEHGNQSRTAPELSRVRLPGDAPTPTNASRGATSPTEIKVCRLPRALTDSERREAVLRFHNEAAAPAVLVHPHIIPICDSGEVNGVPYFAMPLITGGTLKTLLGSIVASTVGTLKLRHNNTCTSERSPSLALRVSVCGHEGRHDSSGFGDEDLSAWHA